MLDILDSSSNMDSRSVALVLKTFKELLSHEKMSYVITSQVNKKEREQQKNRLCCLDEN